MPSVFLSHNKVDKPFVEKLANDLKRIGIVVWFDKWEIGVGDSLMWKVNDGIRENEYLGLIMSPESMDSEWVKKELTAGWVKELNLKRVFILPILYRDCEIPILLADKKYADFRSDYDEGFLALARVFGIKDTETLSMENWRRFTNKRNADWKKYRITEFEKLVTTLVDRAMEYNWSSYVGGTANPFSIQLYTCIMIPQTTIGENVVYRSISKYVTFKLKPRVNSYWASLKEVYNPNHLKSEDFDIYVGNSVKACEEFLWRIMEDFKMQHGVSESKPNHFTERFLKPDEKVEFVKEMVKKLNWYKED